MKRILIILALAVLVALPLIITGCSCGGGATLTESDIATIKGFAIRLDGHDSDIAGIKGKTDKLTPELLDKLAALDADTLGKLAALDTAGLTALLNLDLAAVKTDVTQLKTDVTSLITKVTALENGQSGGSGGSSTTSGNVTVIVDTETQPYVFTSSTTAASYVFPVKITNVTSHYQKVTFSVVLRCISADYKADVTGFTFSLTLAGATFTPTVVSSDTNCQIIYLIWTSGEGIPMAPDKEASYYVTLNGFGTSTYTELWEVSVTNVIVTQL